MDRLTAMKMFVRVVETGSFSAVARELNSSQPTISKNIAELESWLGAKLLNRSTRSLRLTESGADYYERCVTILEDIEQAEQVVGQMQTMPRGLIRVSSMVGFGRLHVIPRLSGFFRRYPDIKIEMHLSDRRVDLVEEGIDTAFRMGHLSDSSLLAKKICDSPTLTVATPEYLKHNRIPQHPNELRNHQVIVYTESGRSHDLQYQDKGSPVVVRTDGRLLTNSSEGLRTALLSSLGIAKAPKWLVGDLLKSGQLVEVLEHFRIEPVDIHVVFPPGRHLPSKIRCFIDFFAEEFQSCDLISDLQAL